MNRMWSVALLLAVGLGHSEGLKCFARFERLSGQCGEELGEIDDEDDCCQNTDYGYQGDDGICRSCGPALWTEWSPWSQCTMLCGDGVRQRTRKCYGRLDECANAKNTLETVPCHSESCCPVAEWQDWGPWTPCSVSCGGVRGVRKRERECHHAQAECASTCVGPRDQTDHCVQEQPCPVDGGWAEWSPWGACSATCVKGPFTVMTADVVYPSRSRRRTCSNPSPSSTSPPGNKCKGEDHGTQSCSELPNCPVDGGWGSWGPPGPCSVSCGEGLQFTSRSCDNPAPQYGGQTCQGPSTQQPTVCRNTCPVHGSWSGWSPWGDCSASCNAEGRVAVRRRVRSCSNPAPSSNPTGNSCPGEGTHTEPCDTLPSCPVDGGWGSWGEYSPCPVSCGVGVQVSFRSCDRPAPNHGGQQCPGDSSRTAICKTNVHCPVNGVWAEWSKWGPCSHAYKSRQINCTTIAGSQSHLRTCQHTAFGGELCRGKLSETRPCYDVNRCILPASWSEWMEWEPCKPACGGNPKSLRRKTCEIDQSKYRMRAGAGFHGTPICPSLPSGEKYYQLQDCKNVPPCT